jgi:hypothetical protein
VVGKYYLGRKIIDSYGKSLGKVVGYYSKSKNSQPIIGLELTDGIFRTISSTNLIDEANFLVLDENWKTKVEELTQDLTLNIRKLSAVNKLYKSGEISQEASDNLSTDFDSNIQDLKAHREDLLERLDERSNILNCKLKEVENYFVNVKVAHELGEIDDESYKISRDALHNLINRLQTEQKDISVAEEILKQTPVDVNAVTYIEKPLEAENKNIPLDSPILLRIEEAEK